MNKHLYDSLELKERAFCDLMAELIAAVKEVKTEVHELRREIWEVE